ncbi:UDP-N-acetylmuramoyl-L-alanine--D-glutamate ligase [Luteibacter aegosomatissinici]|uniref:UDP-N-acetylmuramoyl-L-alanine--D-glutamate ligase n=1 Tax=Luteibacter aegosomatissinici TaxID=2911539 RepID=UPI001FF7AD9D|nr:UDP-N-acetylmuramoyl-L-alanine--D-glutamate ligase [Luteibacter aegosomatissinici]UPG93640.1 UDP-N-acetylmuramoyl-L-alanine--D-glutamate ligase [Luteibacter aegosomatissinici]
MRWADLAGKRIAVWGFGREGRAALDALARRLPGTPVDLYVGADEGDVAAAAYPRAGVIATPPDAQALSRYDVVIKSPGISAYKPELLEAQAAGTHFTSGTALWFGGHPGARTIAVTGTKGKSTTSALIAHLARSLGVRTALAGNIGLPLLELDEGDADLWVIELSSFQTGEAMGVDLGVVTSLYEEHLDWHGSRERYVDDKLKLLAASARVLVNGMQPSLLDRALDHPGLNTFGGTAGWHVAEGWIRRGDERVLAAGKVAAPGLHNAINACAALAALELMGLDARAAAPALATFLPLPHRLQPLGERDGLRWINDSISTTPLASLAALESVHDGHVALIVGGHDRGLDWSVFVDAMRKHAPDAIICQGRNGPRIADALEVAGVANVFRATDLAAAVGAARNALHGRGTVVLSPGAPSFDQFKDYADRGKRFAEMAGFEAKAASIQGLGIA